MITSGIQARSLDGDALVGQGAVAPERPNEWLPLTVGIVRDEATLLEVVAQRRKADEHHHSDIAID